MKTRKQIANTIIGFFIAGIIITLLTHYNRSTTVIDWLALLALEFAIQSMLELNIKRIKQYFREYE